MMQTMKSPFGGRMITNKRVPVPAKKGAKCKDCGMPIVKCKC